MDLDRACVYAEIGRLQPRSTFARMFYLIPDGTISHSYENTKVDSLVGIYRQTKQITEQYVRILDIGLLSDDLAQEYHRPGESVDSVVLVLERVSLFVHQVSQRCGAKEMYRQDNIGKQVDEHRF